MPIETPTDEAIQIATTLIRAIQNIRKENQKFQGRHGYALQYLATIFGTNAENIEPTPTDTKHALTTPKAPDQIRAALRTHQRVPQVRTSSILPKSHQIISMTPTSPSEGAPIKPS